MESANKRKREIAKLDDPLEKHISGEEKRRKREEANTFPADLPEAEKELRRAEMALECYNKLNFANYQLVPGAAMLTTEFTNDGESWVHCNFTATKSSTGRRLFFAEMHRDSYPKATAIRCQVLQDRTSAVCTFCHAEVIHPGPPFLHGYRDDSNNVGPTTSTVITTDGDDDDDNSFFYDDDEDLFDRGCVEEEWGEYARRALEYYNDKNGTGYEPVSGVSSYGFLRDGGWIHCNFKAKLPDSDVPERFAAEMRLRGDVTACVILDGEKNTKYGCWWCPGDLAHPRTEFLKGYDSE